MWEDAPGEIQVRFGSYWTMPTVPALSLSAVRLLSCCCWCEDRWAWKLVRRGRKLSSYPTSFFIRSEISTNPIVRIPERVSDAVDHLHDFRRQSLVWSDGCVALGESGDGVDLLHLMSSLLKPNTVKPLYFTYSTSLWKLSHQINGPHTMSWQFGSFQLHWDNLSF